jgi:hypothetical protein
MGEDVKTHILVAGAKRHVAYVLDRVISEVVLVRENIYVHMYIYIYIYI